METINKQSVIDELQKYIDKQHRPVIDGYKKAGLQQAIEIIKAIPPAKLDYQQIGLSDEFTEKYKLYPVTDKVINLLSHAVNPITVIEKILTMFEDLNSEVIKQKIHEIENSELNLFRCCNCKTVNQVFLKPK